MNRKLFFLYLLGGMMLAMTGGCSGSDDEETNPADDGRKVRHLTITQVDTRATLSESGNILSASWTAGDGLTYFNMDRQYDDQNNSYYYGTGPLTAASSAPASAFTGSVRCGINDDIVVVYPATSFTEPVSEGGTASYTIALSGQNGILSSADRSVTSLAKDFHYVYGVATITSVTDNTANATITMKSLLTVCKFSFVDSSDNPISVNKLVISYVNDGVDGDAGSYPQTATVVTSDAQDNVHASGIKSNVGLTVNVSPAQYEVYVALLPTGGNRTFHFAVNDTYTGEATAELGAGEYVVANNLKLN